ncbi:MAG: thioredoxin fold domain-containing protein [Thioalkalispiraceae bacterium]|jgi:thioredoxin-related protein
MNIIKLILLASLSCLLLNPLALQAGEFKDSTLTHIKYPAWFINTPFLELNEDLANARANGKQGLMVVYSTEGCSYCGLFIQKSLGDPEIAALVRKHFDSVGLEIFDDTILVGPRGQETTVKEFAKQQGVMFSPTILFYDNNGKRVLRITGYQSPERFKTSLSYVTGKHYQSQSMADYVKRSARIQARPATSTSLKQDPLFAKPPYLLQRNIIPASQPLLVIFEQADCEECDIFHNKVLADKQVRESLKKYEVVRLNSRDDKSVFITPDGSRMTPAMWYQQEGFSRTPALLFFSERGHAAIKTDNLVLQQRMMNSINYMNEQAYLKGWSYQRFARSKAIERNLKKAGREK